MTTQESGTTVSNILGCFVSSGGAYSTDDQKTKDIASERTKEFFKYIWGEKGISKILKTLKKEDYGKDLHLILFQFYVRPIPAMLQVIKEIGNYRPKEKSMGISIIITDENFFDKSEEERYAFLRESIFRTLDLTAKKKRKLDTNFELLKSDLQKILI